MGNYFNKDRDDVVAKGLGIPASHHNNVAEYHGCRAALSIATSRCLYMVARIASLAHATIELPEHFHFLVRILGD